MFILPIRSLQRAAGLIIIASLMSGCFQTAGAALQATMTPQGGAVVQLPSAVPTTEVPPPTAITPATQVTTPLATNTVSVPTLVFATQTGLPALPSDTPAVTNTLPVTDTPIPTDTPTNVSPPSNVPTNTPVPSVTPSNIPTNIPQPTVPTETPSPVPTQLPTTTPTQNILGTKVALQATFDSQGATQTQQAIYDQATSIVATATAGQAAAETAIATALGTGIPPQSVPSQEVNPNVTPGVIVQTFTPTPLPSLNSTPQSGAMGNITNDCRYTVVDGDRLYRIALRFGLTQNQLANANRMVNPDLIVPDEILLIPNCSNATPVIGVTTAVPRTPVAAASGQTYMVVDGDTLYSIATRFGVRVIALAQANGITNLNLIYIGQNLTIP